VKIEIFSKKLCEIFSKKLCIAQTYHKIFLKRVIFNFKNFGIATHKLTNGQMGLMATVLDTYCNKRVFLLTHTIIFTCMLKILHEQFVHKYIT